jgi:uncharacterized membrane-anchored protein YhcB (DUF1043 family)
MWVASWSREPRKIALDEPVEPSSKPQYGSDAAWRLLRMQTDASDPKSTTTELQTIVAPVVRTRDAMLTHFATKADLATSASRLETKLSSLDAKPTAVQASPDSKLTSMQTTRDATPPHFATKAELADKPGKTYM